MLASFRSAFRPYITSLLSKTSSSPSSSLVHKFIPAVVSSSLAKRVFSSVASTSSSPLTSVQVCLPGQILDKSIVDKNWWSMPPCGLNAKLQAPVVSLTGDAPSTQLVDLDSSLFNVPIRRDLLHNVVTWQRANWRQGTNHSKTRAEVAGGGRKPWRQKKTGRARAGSNTSPLWVGGGASHGPRNNRVWAFNMNKRVRTFAVKSALTAKFAEGTLVIVDNANLAQDDPEVLEQARQRLGWNDDTVLLYHGEDVTEEFLSAAEDCPWILTNPSSNVSVYDILKYKRLVLTLDGLKALQEELASRKESSV